MQAAPDWDDISQNQRDLPTSGIEFVSHYRFIWNYGYQDVVLRIAALLSYKLLSGSLGLADQCRLSTRAQGFGAPSTLNVLKF